METSNRTKLGEEQRQPVSFILGITIMVLGFLCAGFACFWIWFAVGMGGHFFYAFFIIEFWISVFLCFFLIFSGPRIMSPKQQVICPNCGFDKETVKGYTKTYVCSGCNAKSKVVDGWLELVEDDGE